MTQLTIVKQTWTPRMQIQSRNIKMMTRTAMMTPEIPLLSRVRLLAVASAVRELLYALRVIVSAVREFLYALRVIVSVVRAFVDVLRLCLCAVRVLFNAVRVFVHAQELPVLLSKTRTRSTQQSRMVGNLCLRYHPYHPPYWKRTSSLSLQK